MDQYLIASLLYRYRIETQAVSPLPIAQADVDRVDVPTVAAKFAAEQSQHRPILAPLPAVEAKENCEAGQDRWESKHMP